VSTGISEQPQHATAVKVKKKNFNFKTFIVVICFIALAGATAYFYHAWQQARSTTPAGITSKNQTETNQVISALKQVIIPTNPTNAAPTVAKVESPATLKKTNSTFYKNVQQGDYLILYPQQAIIFRLSNKQVINVAPIIDAGSTTNGTSNTNK
jgi:hypothetical protein